MTKRSRVFKRPGGYFTFDRQVYKSPAFRALSKIERLALLHLNSYYIPERCEVIFMSSRRLATEISVNKDSAARALRRLEEVGFIKVVDESMWLYGKSRSYVLTFRTCGGRMPTDEWSLFQLQSPSESDSVSVRVGRIEVKSSLEKAKCHGD
jgi:hypothetical protein